MQVIALAQFDASLIEAHIENHELSPLSESIVVNEKETNNAIAMVAAFHRISEKIDENSPDGLWELGSDGLTILCDPVDASSLSITANAPGWDQLIALLVVSHPDVNWAFLDIKNIPPDAPDLKHYRIRSAIEKHELCELFDVNGLRQWIYYISGIQHDADGAIAYPSVRRAVSVDEELSFAFMGAYAQYRAGYNAVPVFTWSQLTQAAKLPSLHCTLEDLNAEFLDLPVRIKISVLEERDKYLPQLGVLDAGLDSATKYVRTILTTGSSASESKILDENERYLESRFSGRSKLIYKPIQSIHSIIDHFQASSNEYENRNLGKASQIRRAYSDLKYFLGFYEAKAISDHGQSHSIHGFRALLAQRLMDRAHAVSSAGGSFLYTNILVAVLCSEALRIIANRAPTLSIEALKLREVSEVSIESQFDGVGFDIDLASRFSDIYANLQEISKSYRAAEQYSSLSNHYRNIVQSILKEIDKSSRYSERIQCLNELRKYEFRDRTRKAHVSYRSFVAVFYWYFNSVLGSFRASIAGWGIWLGLFVLMKFLLGHFGLLSGFSYTDIVTTYLFGPQAPDGLLDFFQQSIVVRSFGIACGLVGLFHIGVLISHAFNFIDRR